MMTALSIKRPHNSPTRYGTRTRIVICPGIFVGGPGGVPFPVSPPNNDGFLEALIRLKCSAADKISRLAFATSSFRPVTTKTGSSPRTGVLMYVLVFARNAFILHPEIRLKVLKILLRTKNYSIVENVKLQDILQQGLAFDHDS